MMVEQQRFATSKLIEENPVIATATINSVLVKEIVRVSHETASVPGTSASSVGLKTSEKMYLLCRWTTAFYEGLVITANSIKYKVGKCSEHRCENQVYSKVFSLTVVV